MTIQRMTMVAGLLAASVLGGCDRAGDTPKGQVVATINGEDITTHELNSELALARPPADVPRKKSRRSSSPA